MNITIAVIGRKQERSPKSRLLKLMEDIEVDLQTDLYEHVCVALAGTGKPCLDKTLETKEIRNLFGLIVVWARSE